MPNSEKISKWLRWFDTIEREVHDLIVDRHIYDEVVSIIENSETARQASSFYDLLQRSYIASALIAVRRLSSQGRQEITLHNLMKDIHDNNQLISQERYIKLWKEVYGDKSGWESHWKPLAKDEFDQKYGKRNDFIQEADVQADIQLLEENIEIIKKYTDKRIAHRDKTQTVVPPKYEDLDQAIDSIEQLTIRYGLILKGSMPKPSLLPIWQYDWKQIFRGAWLPEIDE